MDYGIRYDEAPLKADFTPDYALIAQKAPGAKVCHIQRSRGYLQRNAFDLDTIQKIADTARAANPGIIIFVDNCYGEFTQMKEPARPVPTLWWAVSSRTRAAASPPPAAISRAGRIWWSCVPTA